MGRTLAFPPATRLSTYGIKSPFMSPYTYASLHSPIYRIWSISTFSSLSHTNVSVLFLIVLCLLCHSPQVSSKHLAMDSWNYCILRANEPPSVQNSNKQFASLVSEYNIWKSRTFNISKTFIWYCSYGRKRRNLVLFLYSLLCINIRPVQCGNQQSSHVW